MAETVKCLFDDTKLCPGNCWLHDFIEIAKGLGAEKTDSPKPKDPELESLCKLREN